jgi:hypothetical protein
MAGLGCVSACLTEIGIRKSGPFGLLERARRVWCVVCGVRCSMASSDEDIHIDGCIAYTITGGCRRAYTLRLYVPVEMPLIILSKFAGMPVRGNRAYQTRYYRTLYGRDPGGDRTLTCGWAELGVGCGFGGKNCGKWSRGLGLSLILVGFVPFST